MLRPEQMSKVSVTGTRRVMRDVIEATHDLHLVHFSDYDGDIEGFETGSPLSGAEGAADKLVIVRSLKSILGVSEDDAGPTRIVSEERLASELESIRSEVNELDDRRSELEEELRDIEGKLETAHPFVELGYDLDLLSGYDHLDVAVGEGNADEVVEAIEARDDVDAYDVESEGGVVAAFAHAPETDDALGDALLGIDFEPLDVPDASGDPEQYVEELEHRQEKLQWKLERLENEIEEYRLEHAGFLLAAEEKLTIEVQKTEIPLQFATTDHAFVAEGWIPTETFDELESTVETAADGTVAVEELEVADYEDYASEHPAEHSESDEKEATADGGIAFEEDDEPPVVQDNPSIAKPFEILVEMVNRPRYSEYDPTLIVLLTFPLFFGFMIGDVGYGILYVAIGYAMATRLDSDALRSLGGIAVWSGAFTVLFGILYGEIFGMHYIGTILWDGAPPLHKGLQPHYTAYARGWLLATLFVALVHVTAGYVISFAKELRHGLKAAITESGSWALLMLGLWAWIFSRHAIGGKPAFIFEVFNQPTAQIPAENVAIALGFAGFPVEVGLAGLAAAAIGFGLLLLGEGIVGLLESLNVLVNVLSYTRIAAVLLAKAGMAFVVNLLFFGAYSHGGEFHFLVSESPHHVVEQFGEAALTFPGLIHMGVLGILGGIVVFLIGHLVVLALGVTSAGLQAVRLEYVEFFGKFYDGGGAKYHPFGYKRNYTTED
ncbi:V-type ATP synthase subunit I [Halanaeroarchaeum sulfurireducens]|nr:V-type ATP synthase subunit I [Halanaeroarchaeum sulfurireducens]